MLIGNPNRKYCVAHMCIHTLWSWGKGMLGIEQADTVAIKCISHLAPPELAGIEETCGFRLKVQSVWASQKETLHKFFWLDCLIRNVLWLPRAPRRKQGPAQHLDKLSWAKWPTRRPGAISRAPRKKHGHYHGEQMYGVVWEREKMVRFLWTGISEKMKAVRSRRR